MGSMPQLKRKSKVSSLEERIKSIGEEVSDETRKVSYSELLGEFNIFLDSKIGRAHV